METFLKIYFIFLEPEFFSTAIVALRTISFPLRSWGVYTTDSSQPVSSTLVDILSISD